MAKALKILIFCLFFFLPFGQLTKVPLGVTEVSLYFQDIIIVFLVLFYLTGLIFKKIPRPKALLTKPLLIFGSIGLISLFFNLGNYSVREIGIASLYLWRWLFYFGLYFVIGELAGKNKNEAEQFKSGLILAGTATAFLGLAQYFLYPNLRNLAYLGWDPHFYRSFGTFLDPNFLGLFLVLTLIMVFFRLEDESKRGNMLTRYAMILGLILCYLVLALTYSRSSYLAFLAAGVVIARFKKSLKFLLGLVLIGLLTVLFLPRPEGSLGVKLEREDTIRARIINWQQSLTIFKGSPLLGVGFNTYRYAQRNYGYLQENWQESHAGGGADASLLLVLATTGTIGFLNFGYLILQILKYHLKKKNVVLLASLAAVFIHSFFANSLFYPEITIWLMFLLGLTENN
ncbi:MAG: O-antigen ligase family protein [Patescibacteria group bacterium]|nr:O-antigen ligase family protein [Patescibacteria group bacterium]MCL5095311.1 O-antigen ligase family protein [Patescibacteria group bacterium]